MMRRTTTIDMVASYLVLVVLERGTFNSVPEI
jgi:hypothetical protein